MRRRLAAPDLTSVTRKPPPAGWSLAKTDSNGSAYIHLYSGKTVILSADIEADSKLWAHLSIAYPYKLPSYEELCEAKDLFLGPEAKCVMVFAPRSEHVNIHRYCLHLWQCLEDDPLPDFRRHGMV